MEIQDILVKNSFSISGSFEIPIVETTASISTDLATGSMFYDLSSSLLYVASGSEFIVVGTQEGLEVAVVWIWVAVEEQVVL